ncbi:DUF647-domain-containing protein [Laetiporus sulphureus 93-53]|uniref:DUF647-domain-containing protein n=1 Tax=Laetiporus sulphureus 93-53 TaxID=1314785 RepID=A0A165EYN3_9APHY|nr:DUF647-domain-containing protein [Laetiporus sulphureus 93-53]KZT07993.1 DUF647-domain-containing protein [Laetiporus sulphureus 93-53]
MLIQERDDSGRLTAAYAIDIPVSEPKGPLNEADTDIEPSMSSSNVSVRVGRQRTDWRRFFSNVFLPAGYPASVSPDYLQYQIYNALQAFCSSLAGLIASRAVLIGFGVGNANASATHAIFLTALQDVFFRLTTIVSAYALGTSLFPEAKTYRLLADVFNDAAILLDTLSPHLGSLCVIYHVPFLASCSGSPVRVAALCGSSAFRALCGVVAGGSKAALTVHFAEGGSGTVKGDVGDLNAKDGSKETVLALLGMLCGTFVMHYVHSTLATYGVLLTLLSFHLLGNYIAVRVVIFRTLNRQRASILWMTYRARSREQGGNAVNVPVLSPEVVASHERIFTDPSVIRDTSSSSRPRLAKCHLGASFASLTGMSGLSFALPFFASPINNKQAQLRLSAADLESILSIFSSEAYLLWPSPHAHVLPHIHVCMKAGHTPLDTLKAWTHAHETARLLAGRTPRSFDVALAAVQTALHAVDADFSTFVEKARVAGWQVDEVGLVVGALGSVAVDEGLVGVDVGVDAGHAVGWEERKNQ